MLSWWEDPLHRAHYPQGIITSYGGASAIRRTERRHDELFHRVSACGTLQSSSQPHCALPHGANLLESRASDYCAVTKPSPCIGLNMPLDFEEYTNVPVWRHSCATIHLW
jgi:hypothetical protein